MLPANSVSPGRHLLGGAPEGHDARLIAHLAGSGGRPVLHIALDDLRMARIVQMLEFFAPALEVIQIPAWDCLPYDRVSPNVDVVGRRIDALTRLANGAPPAPGRVVVTTVNAVLQRVPPRDAFSASTFATKVGARVDIAALQHFLAQNGYSRTQTVREPGEFAVRGGIVDIFPPGSAAGEAYRLDLFGEDLEGIRIFDPMSQRTTGSTDGIALKPMSEVLLNDASIARFRSGYRELFGAVTDDDPLYEAISEGRRHAGMEHWLPLFHEGLETLFDYLPDGAVTLDHQADEATDTRLTQIDDFHDARRSMQEIEKRTNNPVYKPLPPDRLYLDRKEFDRLLAGRFVGAFSPFAPPEGVAGGVDLGGRRGRDFADARANPDINVFDALRDHLKGLANGERRLVVAGSTRGARERLQGLLADHGIAPLTPVEDWPELEAVKPGAVATTILPMENGFVSGDLAVVSEQDLFGDRLTRPARRRRQSDKFIQEVSSLSPGDLVVHVDHGIGRYDGIVTLEVSGAAHDCLRIIYAGDDKLFVPVENIEVLSRFGSDDTPAQLDKLGGAGWQARKSRVKKRLKDMADHLMRIAALREVKRSDPITSATGAYDEFSARFPYPETDDQLKAIEDVLDDLGSGRPMDRLVCGDVGFGKTEVAMRSAFVAAMAGHQVAIVVPTTLLARQHFKTFSQRFKGLPLKVAQLSRLVGAAETKQVKEGLTSGDIDIIVGTHAILGKSINFKRLGLVIVDEEQHFGVKQKERLKELRQDVHVLTLTATPIPRTLQLALAGVRELSLIATPPVDRLAVRTFVLPFDPVVIREAIMREHFRGGQTYYVCPRIEDLTKVHQRLKELVPEVKIVEAHGRMASAQLENVMTAFYDGQFDVLLSTTIVESGLDVPSANTIVIHRADMFGLAQLYQLRGRIGRSKTRGYAYLTYAPRTALSEVAQRRLHVIETLDTLGAGFSLASHDMDIRGAGNLLGEEQSGHIREVGVELYQQMLEEAVAAARHGGGVAAEIEDQWIPQINLGIAVMIPEDYVPDLNVRLELYRRISRLVDAVEIDSFAAELVDRFGSLPPEVENLLTLIALKRLCKEVGVEKLEAGPRGAVLTFHNNSFRHPERLIDFIGRQAGSMKVRPDHKVVYTRAWDDTPARVKGVQRLMQDLMAVAA